MARGTIHSTATTRLINVCRESHWRPDAAAVRSCIRQGADPLAYLPNRLDENPILHRLVSNGLVDCVAACLESRSSHITDGQEKVKYPVRRMEGDDDVEGESEQPPPPYCHAVKDDNDNQDNHPSHDQKAEYGKSSTFCSTDGVEEEEKGEVNAWDDVPLDLTVDGEGGYTPLHCLCHYRLDDATSAAMLRLFVERVERHPRDLVDWGQGDAEGNDFLTLAASFMKLFVLYPIVKEQPFFADRVVPFQLGWRVWDVDLKLLHEKEQEDTPERERIVSSGADKKHADHDANMGFVEEREGIYDSQSRWCSWIVTVHPMCKLIKESEGTFYLLKCCWASKWNPEPEEVAHWCGAAGANPMYRDGCMLQPVLHYFIMHRNIAVVKSLLTTPLDLDFTLRDISGHTPFSCAVVPRSRGALLHSSAVEREAATHATIQLLSLLLDRLVKEQGRHDVHHVLDTILWGKPKNHNQDLLSLAAQYGVLGPVWRLFTSPLYEMSHYWNKDDAVIGISLIPSYLKNQLQLDTDNSGPIRVTSSVKEYAWGGPLGEAEEKRFDFNFI